MTGHDFVLQGMTLYYKPWSDTPNLVVYAACRGHATDCNLNLYHESKLATRRRHRGFNGLRCISLPCHAVYLILYD